MGYQHKELAKGRWQKLAFVRALELLDLTIGGEKNINYLRELLRLKEALADYFVSDNSYGSSDEKWLKYFYAFSFAARKNH